MQRLPTGIRLNPIQSKDEIRRAAKLSVSGVVLDATGDLSPDQLSATGRRELRHLLKSVELSLIALHLPTRSPFHSIEHLEERLGRAERAFTLGFELGTNLILARVGPPPPEADAERRAVWLSAVRELGLRADHRGVRLGIETGTEPGSALRPVLDSIGSIGLGASIDPNALVEHGFDPIATTRDLGPWVVHAYAPEPGGKFDEDEYKAVLEEISYRGFLTMWPRLTGRPGWSL